MAYRMEVKVKKIIFSLMVILSINLYGCALGKSEEEQIVMSEDEKNNTQESLDKEHFIQEQWEDAYRDIIYNIDKMLADPYDLRLSIGSNEYFYIGIHDFDDNGVPELIIGDSISVAVFTYENNRSKKVADLYEPEDRGGINGLHFNDNMLFLSNAGSDGCGYVGFTYDRGKYITGIYDDYEPEVAIINDKKVSGEEFRQQFNLTEFRQGKNIKNVIPPENSRIEYIKIEYESKGTLIIKEEKMKIDELDFSILQW